MLDVNTVLVKLRPYLDNQFGGFNDSLNELQGAAKDKYLTDIQDIIQNGWRDALKENSNLEFLHILMSNPSESLGLNSSFNKATHYIIRLCLFRLMVDACKENRQLVRDLKWFRDTHTKLAQELNTFNNNERVVLTYNGQRIENLYDVAQLRENLRQEITDSLFSYGRLAIPALAILSMGSSLLRRSASVETQMILSVTISITALLLILYRCTPRVQMAQTHFFANRAEQQLRNQAPGPQAVLQDDNVQKFISVTEADLQQLEQHTPKPSNK